MSIKIFRCGRDWTIDGDLDEIPTDRLRTALAEADDAKDAKRLIVALAYEDGVEVDTFAARFAVVQSTIYYWLDRFASQPPADALRDVPRPGRPPKLFDEQRETVGSWLDEPPEAIGYDTETWRVEDLRDHLYETVDVEYSVAHVSRSFLG